MRAILFCLLIAIAALPASAQQSPSPPRTIAPARPTLPSLEPSAADKAAAEKKERKAAEDRAIANKASAAMDARIDAADRKMRRAMEGICSGCMSAKRKRTSEAPRSFR